MVTTQEVTRALSEVIDPEIGLDLVTLGMIYGLELRADGTVVIQMTLTSHHCPLGPVMLSGVQEAVGKLPGVSRVETELVWEPAWGPECIDPAARDGLRH